MEVLRRKFIKNLWKFLNRKLLIEKKENFMNWKSFFKRVLIIGVLLIPLSLFYEVVSVMLFYKGILLKDIILLVGISLLAAVSIFRFVYRRTERYRVIQSVATIFLSAIVGYFLAFAGVLILFGIFS